MMHGYALRKMTVRARADDRAIDFEFPLEHYNTLGDTVPMPLCLEASGVSNEVVLRSR